MVEASELVKKASKAVGDGVDAVKEYLTKDVRTRVKQRYAELKGLSGAKHVRISDIGMPAVWKTTPGKLQIANLQSGMESANLGRISYYVYALDENGKRKVNESAHNADPVVEKLVVETFERGRPMKTETFDQNN